MPIPLKSLTPFPFPTEVTTQLLEGFLVHASALNKAERPLNVWKCAWVMPTNNKDGFLDSLIHAHVLALFPLQPELELRRLYPTWLIRVSPLQSHCAIDYESQCAKFACNFRKLELQKGVHTAAALVAERNNLKEVTVLGCCCSYRAGRAHFYTFFGSWFFPQVTLRLVTCCFSAWFKLYYELWGIMKPHSALFNFTWCISSSSCLSNKIPQ